MNGTMSRQLKITICGLAAVGLIAATQSGCSSSNSTGTGGATGGGGSTGIGGKTATGGATGTGGSNVDAGPPLCTGVAYPGAPLITDFSDVSVPEGGTGLRIDSKGGVSPYGGVTAVVNGAGALMVTGPVTANTYAGVSIYFDSCIDASTYTGVMFKLTGDFGTCDMLKLGANFPQVESNPPAAHGVCVPGATTNTCYGPGFVYTAATTMVAFADMNGGGAVATVIPEGKNRLTAIIFGFHGPLAAEGGAGGCTVNFTIDDLKFY
jgi:hypothetical protein